MILKWLSALFRESEASLPKSQLASPNETVRPVEVQKTKVNGPMKRLPQGPDCFYDESGKCCRCGAPADAGLFETAEFYRNVRVGKKYPEVVFDHHILKMPVCSKCFAHKVSPGWGYFMYIQKKGYNSWNKGAGPTKSQIESVWQNFLHPKKNVWVAALEEQQRKTVQKRISDAHVLDLPIASIDQYEILKELGRGGFGAVFLARDVVSKTLFAIKGLPEEISRHEEEKERIRKNFSLIAGLHHPCIASPLVLHTANKVEYGSASVEKDLQIRKGDFFLVMEYAKGDALNKWWEINRCRGIGILPPILQQVAAALDFAHSKGILHRDVKPNNIHVYDEPNKEPEVKVLDFGLAAELKLSMDRLVSKPLGTAGTLPYMSPEQWRGESLSVGADVYSLAAVAYELLQGSFPYEEIFRCRSLNDIYSALEKAELSYPRGVWREMDAVLRKGLSKKARYRYFSCAEFAIDFAAAIDVYLARKASANGDGSSGGRSLDGSLLHPLELRIRELEHDQLLIGMSLPCTLSQQKINVFWGGIQKLISNIPPSRLVHANEVLTLNFSGALDKEEETVFEVSQSYKDEIGEREFKEVWGMAIKWIHRIAPILETYSREDVRVRAVVRGIKLRHEKYEEQEKNRNVSLRDGRCFVGNPFYVARCDVGTAICGYYLDDQERK